MIQQQCAENKRMIDLPKECLNFYISTQEVCLIFYFILIVCTFVSNIIGEGTMVVMTSK